MATVAVNTHHQFRVSKPRNLPKITTVPMKIDPSAIDQITYLLRTTQDTLISPVHSGLSFASLNAPLFSAVSPKLTKNNLAFLADATPSRGHILASVVTKVENLNTWLSNIDYSLAGDDDYVVNYLDEYSLWFESEATNQHVENISYVLNIEDFTENLLQRDAELEIGDDCEQFYYKKMHPPVSQFTAVAGDVLANAQDIEFDPRLFEETVQSPLSFDEGFCNMDEYVMETVPLQQTISLDDLFTDTFLNTMEQQTA